ncbi:LysM peptidoglycan-binding domain-containing protein [Marinilongibacter aquaticus]|uniref:LysM peptidoglycan-binding domain-containing protein n=1 Tax=Marinilongibacter aquaticus TaxID=2975157 RepID=UPI0021BDAC85|nr:LysM peptidoglycan-binding domain-containing protein [Marinilongibacter aquaticus]UBM59321.1 LysM peptidoglycan-binding domain-containing protein [Marinilongibacter aquaticus]
MKTVRLTLLLSCCLVNAFAFTAAPFDSLGIRAVSGKHFIMHRVDAKETLYSLLRRYACTRDAFLRANPSQGGSNTIYIDQVLLFPTEAVLVQAEEKPKPELAPAPQEQEKTSRMTILHRVAPGETLYSISKRYAIDVEALKELNKLMDNEISVGQALKVRTAAAEYDKKLEEIDSQIDRTPVSNAMPDGVQPVKVYVKNAHTGEKVTETGIAEVIPTKKSSNQMLALHKTAPLGSLLMIKNTATGNRVVVKVIGKLPNTGVNENILVRLSPSAFYKLDPKDIRIRAEVTYVKPPNI